VRVIKCLAQEHNTVSQARARTRTACSGDERTNHEATIPPTVSYDCNIRQINTKPEVNYFTFVLLFLVTGNSAFEIADSIMGATNLIHMFARLVIF